MSNESEQPSKLSPLKQAFIALEETEARLEASERARHAPVAVVGIGCRIPGGPDNPERFWEFLRDGRSGIRPIPEDRWDVDRYYDPDPDAPGKMNVRCGGFLDSVDRFDPQFFGIAPREAVAMDPQQRLLLEVAWEALENAGQSADRLAGSRTGVFVGVSGNDYSELRLRADDPKAIDAYYAQGIAHSIASGRLSYVLGLQGPSLSIDTACSSSLVAVHQAVLSLRAGECNLALAGGVNLILSPSNSITFAKSGMLSPDGQCKTFDGAADGFARGEGCGMLALKRLDDALADGDPIHAVIRGSAINSDGASSGITVPNGPAQVSAIRDALDDAGLEPDEVGYVEAHGTGTSLGDPIEVQAAADALGAGRDDSNRLMIGSLKTNVGHLESAAGVAGLIKAILCVREGQVPPHLNFQQPSPHIPWDEIPVDVVTELRDWPETFRERIAGVSSFGFSGTNAHILVSAPPEREQPVEAELPARGLFTLSTGADETLAQSAKRQVEYIRSRPDNGLNDLCRGANTGRAALVSRAAIVADSRTELIEALNRMASAEPDRNRFQGRAEAGDRHRVAFLFTGQGSQRLGMGAQLYRDEPVFRGAIDRCDAVLKGSLGASLIEIVFAAEEDNPSAPLHRTGMTQPALFAVEFALSELWKSWGIRPSVVLGHSVGEYVAACVAGVFSVEDGLRLVAERARRMEALPEGGGMAAVFADEPTVAAALRGFEAELSIAAINGPTNVVISGTESALATVLSSLKGEGIKSRRLQVSHAFHSPLMEPMLDGYREVLASVSMNSPRIRLISNITGKPADAKELTSVDRWCRHIRSAVRYEDSIRAVTEQGIRLFLECGPSPTLVGMAAKCVDLPDAVWLTSLRKGVQDDRQIRNALAGLFVHGVEVDWAAFHGASSRTRVALASTPFRRERYWIDSPKQQPPGLARPASRRGTGHPLLGDRIRSPLEGDLYESTLRFDDPGFIEDHVVHGWTVFPATAYLEVARAAAESSMGWHSADLLDLEIHEALTLPTEGSRALQVLVDVADSRVSIYSIGEEDDAPKLHARARLGEGSAAGPPAPEVDDLSEEVQIDAFYKGLWSRGLNFAEGFHGVQELRRKDGLAVGVLRATPRVAEDDADYGIHPALLDAALQVLAAAIPGFKAEDAESDIFMPIGLDKFSLSPSGSMPVRSVASVEAAAVGNSETLTGHIWLLDDSGSVVGTLRGLHLKRVSPADLARIGQDPLADQVFEIAWKETEAGTEDLSASFVPTTAELSAELGPRLAPVAEEFGIQIYDELMPDLERLSLLYVVRAFRKLGMEFKPGETITAQRAVDSFGVLPQHRQLIVRFCQAMGQDGILRSIGGNKWEVVKAAPAEDPVRLAESLLSRYASQNAELEVTRRCGDKLSQALTGVADPLHLLFPGGDLDAQSRIYRETPIARTFNTMLRQAAAEVAGKLPAGRKLRVLEIGGGTGGTTTHVLPILPVDRTEYTFTDIGKLFVARAEEAFAEFPFVRYSTLDIDADPVAQGFELGSYDLVFASNVIHATSDLSRTLRRVRALMRPEALLCMLEITSRQLWVDITVGLTEGWWSFTDTELRSDYALLDQAGWTDLLQRSGFDSAVAIPEAEEGSILSNQAVLVARNSEAAAQGPSCLLLGNPDLEDRLLQRLAEELEQRGASTAICESSDLVGLDDAGQVGKRLANSAASLPAVPDVVIDLRPTEVQDLGALTTQTLTLAQALVSDAFPSTPRVVWATRGAQAVVPGEGVRNIEQAMIWGFCRSLVLEHPELAPMRVDLDPDTTVRDVELVDWILRPSGEGQGAIRGDRRFAPRLRRTEAGVRLPSIPNRPMRLSLSQGKTLDDLRFVPAPRRAPEEAEVEIEIVSSGLNFRDVVQALGVRSDSDQLGTECVGRVVRIGAAVEHLNLGDRVVAAAGAFAPYATLQAEQVVTIPEGLTWNEAGTLPIAYLTADVALQQFGEIRQGQSILIHAAAGGVGLAAVELCRAAGLTVLATAGSETKREFLRSRGIEHVFDSRSLAFAAEVMRVTDGRGVDHVLNSLAGDFIEASVSVLAENGRLLELGKTGVWDDSRMSASPQARPGTRYFAIDLSDDLELHPERLRPRLQSLVDRVARGELRPLPSTSFALEDAVEAFRYMAQARHIGKILLQVPAEPSPTPFREDGTYLITGGLSGLGLLFAERLAEGGAGALALMARSAPDAEALQAVRRIEDTGTKVTILQGDVGVESDVARAVVEATDPAKPLRGVLHSAGLLDDAALLQQNLSRFEHVYGPKVHGTANLDLHTRTQPLEFFVAFSSVAAVLGSPGQVNHSAANAIMDASVQRRVARGLPGLSVNWGAWGEIGAAVRHDVGNRAARLGVKTLAPEAGVELLWRLIGRKVSQAVVSPMDWSAFLAAGERGRDPFFQAFHGERRRTTKPEARPTASKGSALLEKWRVAAPAKKRSVLLSGVQAAAVRVLGLSSSHPLDRRQPLGELGLDSLMAVELRNALGQETGLSLPATLLFDFPTVEALADAIVRELAGSDAPEAGAGQEAAEPETPDADAGSMLDRIENLTDEEVEQLMRQSSKSSGS